MENERCTEPLKVGARDSALSLLQAQSALDQLSAETRLSFVLRPFSSPGDRDKVTDLRQTPGNFFTQDLDEALLTGALDFAIHSAKDLPEKLAEGLDWFWLPWREDSRDCIVATTASPHRIGVSSARREAFARLSFPEAECCTLRGTIPERLAQLDAGTYDALIVASAALHRLGLAHRITRYISVAELPPPPGQGVLAVTFRRDDRRLRALRNLYIKAVRFIGAGVGDAELCTIAGLRELLQAECVIYDALMDDSLLDFAHGQGGLAPLDKWRAVRSFEAIYVGKRSGAHAMKQEEITALIGERVRRGERVVRLKGGDPGMFGRLAEEVDALTADAIPFRVWPGVSALNAATTATGMLLTQRGESKGFCVETPRSQGEAKTDIYFMALGVVEEIARRYAPETPAAIVYDAASPAQKIVRGTVATLRNATVEAPGLLIVGAAALRGFDLTLGPLGGRRIWVTGSSSVAEKARVAITDLGGIPVVRPLVWFAPTATLKIRPSKGYNLLLCTSPTAARMLFSQMVSPIYFLPKKIAVTGPGTAEIFAPYHVDLIQPEKDFSARGLLATLPEDLSAMKILRIRSEEAGPSLAEALRARGAKVKDYPLYQTRPLTAVEVPPHDAVFLASSSAAEAWLLNAAPQGQEIVVMGEPTAKTLREMGLEPTVVAPVQTVREAIFAYALRCAHV
ncbi:MAG: SAM-dependent methyltransferase [Kiritimatiellia bacterium]